jgi:hypothetical protein
VLAVCKADALRGFAGRSFSGQGEGFTLNKRSEKKESNSPHYERKSELQQQNTSAASRNTAEFV